MAEYKYTPADFKSDQQVKWCPGCGDHAILNAVQRAMPEVADALDIPVALLEGCADPYSHKVVRSSMGAVFRTPVVSTTWQEVKQSGIPVAVTALSARSRNIRQAEVEKMAVVIGSEGQGVRQEILAAADAQLIIPMNQRCESLNAAIAAAIAMWQKTV